MTTQSHPIMPRRRPYGFELRTLSRGLFAYLHTRGDIAPNPVPRGLQIHQVPVLFGSGRRLFDVLPTRVELEIVRVIDTPGNALPLPHRLVALPYVQATVGVAGLRGRWLGEGVSSRIAPERRSDRNSLGAILSAVIA